MGRKRKSQKTSDDIMRRHFCISVMTDENGKEITEDSVAIVDERILHQATNRPVNYMIWNLEVAPETGRLHYHVYVEYETSVRLRTIRKEWTEEVGWGQQNIREGTRGQARTYCGPDHFHSKHGLKANYTHLAGPWEIGEWREDDDAVHGVSREQQAYLIIAEGGHPRDVAHSDPQMYGRCYRGLYALYNELRGVSPK